MKSRARDAVQFGLGKVGFRLIQLFPTPAPAATLNAPLVEYCRVAPSREFWLSTLPQGGCVAEIGVAFGTFAEQILEIVKPQALYLIDAWESPTDDATLAAVRQKFHDSISSGRVEIRQGHSIEVLPQFPDDFFDLAYIDTAHTYELTMQELAECARVVKPNGRIAGHDYCDGTVGNGCYHGVMQAVNEFCLSRNWGFETIALSPRGAFSFCIRDRRTWDPESHHASTDTGRRGVASG